VTAPAVDPAATDPGRHARLGRAFRVALGELGHAAAAWLFAREVAACVGDAGVASLRDGLGREYPVLDAVCERWLSGRRGPDVDPAPVAAACAGAGRVLVVGVEAEHLDALVPALGEARVGLVRLSDVEADWGRVLANLGPRVEGVDLGDVPRWAGARSVLLTFAYGLSARTTHVLPAWVRVHGPDVRSSFRALVAWDVLGGPMFVHPRWLVQVELEEFSHLVAGTGG
jgi:hypothetical protein